MAGFCTANPNQTQGIINITVQNTVHLRPPNRGTTKDQGTRNIAPEREGNAVNKKRLIGSEIKTIFIEIDCNSAKQNPETKCQ